MNLKKIRRIAVIRNDRVGDVVCTLPVLEALRKGLPEAHITAIVDPKTAPLLERHPHVDQLQFDREKDPPKPLVDLLRAGRFDAVLVSLCTRRNSWAAFRARVPIRVTHGRRWFQALCGTHRCYPSRKTPPFHEAAFNLAFTERLGIPFTLGQAKPWLYVDPILRAQMQKRIVECIGGEGPLFGMHAGSAGSAFTWPAENYLATIQRLAKVGRVVITGGTTGGRHDRSYEWIESQLTPRLRERVVPIPGLDLRELLATLSLYDAFLGSSSGPLHLAALVSRHALGLYSDAFYQHPRRWGPIGPNASVLIAPWTFDEEPNIRTPLADEHMAQIKVDAVVEHLLEAVARRQAA